jgi:LacI family transcriptional regulator
MIFDDLRDHPRRTGGSQRGKIRPSPIRGKSGARRKAITRFLEVAKTAFLDEASHHASSMSPPQKSVALILPPVPAYSRGLMEGVIEFHSTKRPWILVDLPHWRSGRSPLPAGGVELDGAIIWADRNDRWVEQLVGQGVRVVNCGSAWTGSKGVATVRGDRGDVHQQVLDHFSGLGFSQVSVIGHRLERRPVMKSICDDFTEMARKRGIGARSWSLAGRDNPDESPGRILHAERELALARHLAELPKPAAIYCENDHIAVIVIRVARSLGLRVPQDVAVVGYGENLVARFSAPPLTSILPPARMIGRAAAAMLQDWLTGGSQPPDRIIPGAALMARESSIGISGSVELERVRRRIALHACDGITINDLVAISGKSFKTLVRRYTEAFGIDPLDEIRQLRIARAKQLLRGSDLSVAEIATACGFTSQASFYNYFLRHTAISPSDFRGKRQGGAED